MINTDELCDAQGVAGLVGLAHANSVHTYLRRYADMPRPVIDLGPGRPRLWLRPQIEAWLAVRGAAPSAPPLAATSGVPGTGGAGAGVGVAGVGVVGVGVGVAAAALAVAAVVVS